MHDGLRNEIDALAGDTKSGATAILTRAVAVLLKTAREERPVLEEVAAELCRAQPSMAGLRTAAIVARRASDPIAALEEFSARIARAPRVIARLAVGLLTLRRATGPLRIVTCSRSDLVEQAVLAVAAHVPLEVSCAESRPALEGRDLAAALAGAGVRVTLYTDAGISSAIPRAEAFLTGADAVGPECFLNKVGTAALAALAAAEGVPMYVLAGREKFVPADVFASLSLTEGSPGDVWPEGDSEVAGANPYFEPIRTSLAAAFVTDAGVMPAGEIAALCKI